MTAKLRSWWRYIRKHWVATIIIVFVGVIVLIALGYLFKWEWAGFSGTNQITITSTSKGNYTATIPQPSKSLWDWLGLLAAFAIPLVVGFGVAWFTRTQQLRDQEAANLQHKRDEQLASDRAQIDREAAEKRAQIDREISLDNQRAAALEAYIDKMSELLLKEHLGELTPEGKLKPEYDEARKIARIRTLTVLPLLDPLRKKSVLQFLYEGRLIDNDQYIVNEQCIVFLGTADFSKLYLSTTVALS